MIDMQREEWLSLVLRELPDRHHIITASGNVYTDCNTQYVTTLQAILPTSIAEQILKLTDHALASRQAQSLTYSVTSCQQLQRSIEELDELSLEGESWFKSTLKPIQGPSGEKVVIWQESDITKEYFYQQELKRLSETDELTGTLNRRAFLIELEETLKSSSSPASCLMVDIDHFKEINDQVGHLSGDSVIVHVAKLCMDTLPSNSIIGRLGGEEFCILVKDASAIETYELAENVREAISHTPCKVDEHIVYPTVSIGISEKSGASTTARSMLIEADKAMYYSKQTGRDQVTIYYPNLPEVSVNANLNVRILRAS